MARKSTKKSVIVDVKENTDKESRWEDLVKISDDLIDDLVKHQGLISGFIKEMEPILKEDNRLRETLVGGLINFTKLTDIVFKTRESHYATKEVKNDKTGEMEKVIDADKPRTGVIDPNSEDYLDYIEILNNYATASSHLGSLASQYGSEVLVALQINKKTKEAAKDVNKNKFDNAADLFANLDTMKDSSLSSVVTGDEKEGTENGK